MTTASNIKRHSAQLMRHVLPALAGTWQLRLRRQAAAVVAAALVSGCVADEKVPGVSKVEKVEQPKTVQGLAAWTNDLSPIAPSDWNYDRAGHLLERAGFGGTPQEIEKLAAMTPVEAVDYLVDYESIDVSHLPVYEPSNTYPHGHRTMWGRGRGGPGMGGMMSGKVYGINARREGIRPFQPVITEFFTLWKTELVEMWRGGQWWADRMLKTPRPLEEKLTLFWHGHFATSQMKVLRYEHMLNQVETFRKHANGNFRDLLVAVAQDPAMLFWLDNKDNVKGKPNENFAREVMELFTMGEGQGYTEDDIREIARAFTGWTLTPDPRVEITAEFVNNSRFHDDGEKSFLGEKGNFDGDDAIDIILKQEATPIFISSKLYRFFVRQEVGPEVQKQLAKILVDAKYEFKPLLKTLFLSRDFYSEPSSGTQIKSPVHLVVSTYRKLGMSEIPGIPDYNVLTEKLGQQLFYPPNVAGWAGGRTWTNPATLLMQGNFVHSLLFPDPDSFIPPDKLVIEEYRKIPFMFPKYKEDLTCYIWSPEKQQMEPVSDQEYTQFLARVNGITSAVTADLAKSSDKAVETAVTRYTPDMKPKSAIVQMASQLEERGSLVVGAWMGYIKTFERVKPIPRTTARLDFVAMVKAAKVTTVEEAFDHFSQRFLRVNLQSDRRAAVVDFVKQELGSAKLDYGSETLETTLRRLVHLILSAPEYQLG